MSDTRPLAERIAEALDKRCKSAENARQAVDFVLTGRRSKPRPSGMLYFCDATARDNAELLALLREAAAALAEAERQRGEAWSPEWACVGCGHVGREGFSSITYNTPGEPTEYDMECVECGSREIEESATEALNRRIREDEDRIDAATRRAEAAEAALRTIANCEIPAVTDSVSAWADAELDRMREGKS